MRRGRGRGRGRGDPLHDDLEDSFALCIYKKCTRLCRAHFRSDVLVEARRNSGSLLNSLECQCREYCQAVFRFDRTAPQTKPKATRH